MTSYLHLLIHSIISVLSIVIVWILVDLRYRKTVADELLRKTIVAKTIAEQTDSSKKSSSESSNLKLIETYDKNGMLLNYTLYKKEK